MLNSVNLSFVTLAALRFLVAAILDLVNRSERSLSP